MSVPALRTLRQLYPAPSAPQTTHFKNGVGAFVLPCFRIDILYDHPRIGRGGSSRGVVDLIIKATNERSELIRFAKVSV